MTLSDLDNKKLIVSNYCSIYTVCNEANEQNALKKAIESNNEEIKLFKRYIVEYPKNSKYWQDRLKEAENKTFKIMMWSEYEEYEKIQYLQGEPKEITEEEFDDALNCLPPLKWCTINGIEQFLMSEFYTGTYTNQYAKKGNKYYTKMVDASNKETWLHNIL